MKFNRGQHKWDRARAEALHQHVVATNLVRAAEVADWTVERLGIDPDGVQARAVASFAKDGLVSVVRAVADADDQVPGQQEHPPAWMGWPLPVEYDSVEVTVARAWQLDAVGRYVAEAARAGLAGAWWISFDATSDVSANQTKVKVGHRALSPFVIAFEVLYPLWREGDLAASEDAWQEKWEYLHEGKWEVQHEGQVRRQRDMQVVAAELYWVDDLGVWELLVRNEDLDPPVPHDSLYGALDQFLESRPEVRNSTCKERQAYDLVLADDSVEARTRLVDAVTAYLDEARGAATA